MFMPQRPYLPLALRAAVSYPAEPGRFDDAAVRAALERVDLGHLTPSLDRTERGPSAVARRAAAPGFRAPPAHAPRWVFLDDAIGALDEEHRRRVLALRARAARGAVIRLGRDPAQDGFWTRTLHIVERPDGPCLRAGPSLRSRQPRPSLGSSPVQTGGKREQDSSRRCSIGTSADWPTWAAASLSRQVRTANERCRRCRRWQRAKVVRSDGGAIRRNAPRARPRRAPLAGRRPGPDRGHGAQVRQK